MRTAGANGTYQIRDGTNVTRGADGTLNPIDPATGLPILRQHRRDFEFRAVDRNLRTPYVQQWNLGVQYEVTKNLLVEVRYVGIEGDEAAAGHLLHQGYDLNDPNTPDFIFERFNQAYVAAGSPNGPLNAGTTARERGVGRAFGFANSALGGMIDYNLANPAGAVITFEGALALSSASTSRKRSCSATPPIPSTTRRSSASPSDFRTGLQFNAAYTFSKSIDNASAIPAARPAAENRILPNVGFTAQGNAFDTQRQLRAVSDFDRPHRFSMSYVYDIPSFGSRSKLFTGWRVSGFGQAQSGLPYYDFLGGSRRWPIPPSINNLRLGSGGLYRLAFGRPSAVRHSRSIAASRDRPN